MEWRGEYERKLVSADEAVKVVKSGDRVMGVPLPHQVPRLLIEALARRRQELRNVTILMHTPTVNPGWFEPGWEESFNLVVQNYIGDLARPFHDAKRLVFEPTTFSTQFKGYDDKRPEWRELDVFMGVVTPPNPKGFVSFGPHLWNKRGFARRAKKVIVEVDSSLIWTYGDCYMHVSQIDCFVEHTPPSITEQGIQEIVAGAKPEWRADLEKVIRRMDLQQAAQMPKDMWHMWDPGALARFLGFGEPPEHYKQIARHVSEIVKDGDTIQIGTGEPSLTMAMAGAFNNKHDLGLHTEMACPGLAKLVDAGVITNKYKTIHRGKAVASTWTGSSQEDIQIIDNDPRFELYDSEYVVNIRTVSQIENMVAINNAISVDFTGQINSESVFGARMINGTGGQPEMHIGAFLARGGRAITLMPSTRLGGSLSSIAAQFDAGSIITIPRYFADIVITEYGVARLLGKSVRERAEALINIAHPDFRAELRKEAQKLFYP